MEIIDIKFIKEIKQQILQSRYHAAKSVNGEMLKLYYNIGMSLNKKFENEKWGTKILDKISAQLQQELPGLRGFSARSMLKMKSFYIAWNYEVSILPLLSAKLKNTDKSISPSLTAKLENDKIKAFLSVSFTHHYEIILRVKEPTDRWYYINKIASSFWSVRHLRTELKNKSHLKEQKQPNNFKQSLPYVIKALALIGTIAMILVAGGIYVHNIHYLYDFFKNIPSIVSELIVGLIVGFIALIFICLFLKIKQKIEKSKNTPYR